MAVDAIECHAIDDKVTKPDALSTVDDIPQWLNNDFLQKYLRKHFGNKAINVIKSDAALATAKGDNYASCIFRVKVTFNTNQEASESKELSVIVKTSLPGDFAFESLSACNVYDKEIEFYGSIAPQIIAKYRQLNEPHQLLPDTYGVCTTNKAILFEDLSLKNYRLSSVQRGFNMAESKFILRKAAAMHAINAVLQQNQPDIFKNFKHGLITRDTDALNTFYLTQFDAVIEAISAWPDFAGYAEKLRRLRGGFMERGRLAFDAVPGHFNTLIHGDMWTNNLMTRWSSGAEPDANDSETPPDNVVILDFQYSCWTSPTIELHYFFNTSMNETLRVHHMDEMFEFYHGNLVAYLKQLKYNKHIPTLDELRKQYREKSFYGFVASCLIQPIMVNEYTENADFEALCVGDQRSIEFKRLMYSLPKTHDNLRRLIPFYDRLGVFD